MDYLIIVLRLSQSSAVAYDSTLSLRFGKNPPPFRRPISYLGTRFTRQNKNKSAVRIFADRLFMRIIKYNFAKHTTLSDY